jgi:uncharacterized protein YbjT (DUF2867 family)
MNDLNHNQDFNKIRKNNTLLLGGNGKTGRRIAERLKVLNVPVRIGSRSSEIPFDWQEPDTWQAVIQGMDKIYITFYPDLALPGAVDVIRAFTELAVNNGVQYLVLLSGRGEEEALACEQIVQQAGVEWAILRASWFCQNFSEGFMRDLVLEGVVPLPPGEVKEPFIDADDIADVAVAALTEYGHAGQIYEMTGSKLLTFGEAVQHIASATGREINYVQIPKEDFTAGLKDVGLPEVMVNLYTYLFAHVLDGRNEYLTDGVQRALGRQPRDFKTYAKDAAAAGAW